MTASLQNVVRLDDVADLDALDLVADVVIVGTGAAGATAARVLAERGLEVLMLEEGPFATTEEFRSDMWSAFRRLWRDHGFQAAEGRAFLPVLQGRCVGGTTVINGAILHRLPPPILRHWEREHGLTGWLPERELGRIFDTLDRELSVGTAEEEVLGRNSSLMRRGIEALGLRGNLIRRNVAGCRGSAHCNQGCPTGRKQSMAVTFVPRALADGARLHADCEVESLLVRGGRAVGVRARHRDRLRRRQGPLVTALARHGVLLAASAIQTPLLLARAGVGRRSRLVGRRLQAHPGAAMMGRFDEPVRPWFGATQGYESTHYWDERMKFEAVSMPLEVAAARLPGVGRELVRELAGFDALATWGVQVRSEAHGSVRRGLLGDTAIRFDPTDADIGRLKLGLFRVGEAMFAAGARELLPGVHGLPERVRSLDELRALFRVPDDPRHFHCIAAHLFGTAVVGPDPRSSVVAPDGQCHELAGAYVMDSSLFPTNLGVNPQHSIAAVAWWLAERLADRLGH